MTQEHPITPPPELVVKWLNNTRSDDCIGAYPPDVDLLLATQAARWGADQELEACRLWVSEESIYAARELVEARRPNPMSLKEQALGALYAIATGADDTREFHQDLETIKMALESLPD
jgi:hypothetical protein